MKPRLITVDIEKVEVRGAPGLRAGAVREHVARELERLFAEKGVPQGLIRNALIRNAVIRNAAQRTRTGSLAQSAHATAQTLGTDISRSAWESLHPQKPGGGE